MSTRYPVTIRFNSEEREQLRQLISFWSTANGYTPMTDKDVLKLAFTQLVIGTRQFIKKKESANEFDTKIVGSSGLGDTASAPGAETASASANSQPTHEIVRDESTGNIVEQAVAGT